jgi:HSP20 family protein
MQPNHNTKENREVRAMADITRWDPFREMVEMRDAMDRLFDRGFNRPWRLLTWETGDGFFPVDLYETDDDVVVKASLPGVQPDDVEISVTGDTLTIKAETKEEHEEKKTNFYRQERRYGAFQRALALPVRVDADNAKASFENGVLHLRLPKVPEVKPKSIKIQGNTKVIEGETSS